MFVGALTLSIHILDALSLKDKRSILQSLIKRAQNKFNASIAEVADQDLWQQAVVGVAVVSGDKVHVDQQLQAILNFFESEPRIEVAEVEMEIL